MDRAYIDFERLFLFSLCSAFFVVRAKKNIVLRRRYSRRVDTTTGLRSDQTVILTTNKSAKTYPDPLRRISYFDAGTNKRLKFLTNNFALPALTITQIYKSRWQVELFFKWIKQHLRIKSFFDQSGRTGQVQERLRNRRLGRQALALDTVVDGAIADAGSVSEAIKTVFRTAKFKAKAVATSVSGHSVIVKRVVLPVDSPDEVAASIEFDADQYIPFEISEVNLDYEVIGPSGSEGGGLEVLVVAAKKDRSRTTPR